MRRTGIDLSSTRCIFVDAETPERRRKDGPRILRIRRFASGPGTDSGPALTAELRSLTKGKTFPQRAWVNLWDVRSSHQYRLLPSGRASELESIVRRHGASMLGLADAEVTVATTVGSTRSDPGHHPQTEVAFFAAGSQDVRDGLRPIIEAGFEVEGVTTPCGALWSQARLRRPPLAGAGAVHAYVALSASQSAVGIFRKGSLLYARDIDWGYSVQAAGEAARNREDLAGRLARDLCHSFLYLKQYWEEDVSQVVLCGDMPEIRSLTAPLIERLNIEVETLDTLEGIDAESLPEGFADRAASYRLASAIAAEPPPVNLLPAGLAGDRPFQISQRIIAAGRRLLKSM